MRSTMLIALGLGLLVLPASAQKSETPRVSQPDQPPTAGSPPAPPNPAVEPAELSHDEMVKEQERRDREKEEERDRDDQAALTAPGRPAAPV